MNATGDLLGFFSLRIWETSTVNGPGCRRLVSRAHGRRQTGEGAELGEDVRRKPSSTGSISTDIVGDVGCGHTWGDSKCNCVVGGKIAAGRRCQGGVSDLRTKDRTRQSKINTVSKKSVVMSLSMQTSALRDGEDTGHRLQSAECRVEEWQEEADDGRSLKRNDTGDNVLACDRVG